MCNLSKPSICMGVSVNLPILQHPLTLSFFFFWIGIYGRIRFSAFFARIDIYSPKSLLECKPAHPGQLPWLFSVCLWLPLSPFSLLQFTFFGQTSAFCTCVFFWVISAHRLWVFFLAFRFYVAPTTKAKMDSYHD